MKIVVCIKRVPDTEARIKINDDRTGIDPAGLKYIISPYDEFALEAALRLKEAKGEGEVIVVSVGDSTAAEQLRSALAMGADRAVLLKSQAGMDGLATAKTLAPEIRSIGADVVLCGMKAVDIDQQQVGTMLAELIDAPSVSVVAEFELEDGKAVCHREIEGGVEIVEVALPAVITMTKGKNEPRYPSLKGIMAAKKKPLEERDPQDAATSRVKVRELAYPAERPAGRVVGQGVDAVAELVRLLREEARVL